MSNGRFALGVAWLVAVAQAIAQPAARESMWMLPEAPVAYCAFDGTALGRSDNRTRALVAAGVRGLVGNIASLEGGSSLADELLRARVLGAAPWRVCLLEFEGETVEVKAGAGKREPVRMVRPKKFAAIIEVRTPAESGGHDRFFAAIEAGLGRDAKSDGSPRDRKDLALPGGLKGSLSSSEAEWRDIAWLSTPQSFIVAFGKDAMEKWLKPMQSRGAAWAEHRQSVNKKRGRGEQVFEAFVDLNALRRGVPDEFAGGRLDRLVHAWGIANDRAIMVHGVLMGTAKKASKEGEPRLGEVERAGEGGERVIAIDLSWSSRAEKPGLIHTVAISESQRPAGMEAGEDAWALFVRAGVPSWITVGLDTYEALGPTEFGAIRSRWERRVVPMLERIVPRIGEWVVVRAGLEVTIALKPAKGQDKLASDLRGFFPTLAPVVMPDGKNWTLAGEHGEPELRGLSWRVDGAGLVTEWNQRGK